MASSVSSASDAALPGYQVQLSDSGVEHSAAKLDKCATSLRSFLCSTDTDEWCPQQDDLPIHTSPCLREEDTLSYRCRCTFQLICAADVNKLEYAMRVKHKPVPINATSFPIATQRIQLAMTSFLELINGSRQAEFSILLASRPASISFDSSWDGQDCTATINYTDPLPDKEASWRAKADKLRRTCKLTCFTGRSKKRKFNSSEGDEEIETYINDTITILTSDHDGSIRSVDVGGSAPTQTTDIVEIPISHYSISYMKPEDAFQHPNGNAMKTALKWMLKCICAISGEIIKDGASNKIGMLEMYCGFGAHTVPIAALGLVDFYAAVELDERLIKACQRNCRLNEINAEFCSNGNVAKEVPPKSTIPIVHLFHGDAGLWAMKARHRRHQLQNSPTHVPSLSWYDQDYQILLVDPPRAGLDDNVCQMVLEGPFQHLIYISCGKDALARDIKILYCSFELVDCTLIDLFPRTDAIESLVHLRRRKRN